MSAPDWMKSATQRTPATPDRKAQRRQVEAEQARLTAKNEMDLRARQAELDRQERQHAMQARDEQKTRRAQTRTAEKAARAEARTKRLARINVALPNVGRRVMIVGPILAPMTVAWIGQIRFAQHTLGWPLIGAIIFAAAWEMSTAFCGWMYHQARDDGDQGTIFRAATWFFASTAGAMNYWHALPADHHLDDPTPKAASFGLMSLAGIALWELYTLLIHRKALRLQGKLPESRPRFGLARWTQYLHTTWIARSLSIKYGLTTVDAAWSMALAQKDRKARVKAAKNAAKATKSGRTPVHITVVHGPRTRISMRPLTTWTQPPTVWIPSVRRIELAAPMAPEPALPVAPTGGVPVANTGPALAPTGDASGANSAPRVGANERQNEPPTVANNTPEPVAKTTPELAPTKRRRLPAVGAKRQAARRSLTDWVEVAEPIFRAELNRLHRQPTGTEFAEAIKKAGLGSPSASTAKNIRTEILDRTPLPTLD